MILKKRKEEATAGAKIQRKLQRGRGGRGPRSKRQGEVPLIQKKRR